MNMFVSLANGRDAHGFVIKVDSIVLIKGRQRKYFNYIKCKLILKLS